MSSLLLGYWLCLLYGFGGFGYELYRFERPWSVPLIMVFVTVIGWYLVEPFLFPEDFYSFSFDDFRMAFYCVLVFMVGMSFATAGAVKGFQPGHGPITDHQRGSPER